MAEHTDITSLLGKKDNPDQKTYVQEQGIPKDQQLPADEFINKIVMPIIELQESDKKSIKSIRFNGQKASFDPETGEATINYSETTTYYARLTADRSSNPEYVVKDGSDFWVGLRYAGFKVDAIGNTNLNTVGMLVVKRSTDGGASYVSVASQQMTSLDFDAENFPVRIDLGQYLMPGMKNTIQLEVSTSFVDDFGQTQQRSSQIVFNLQSVNLSVRNNALYYVPILADQLGGAFPLDLSLSGAVPKRLHVEVTGSGTGDVYEQSNITANSVNISLSDSDAKGLLSHGVHEVRMWVSCDDGVGGTIYSDVEIGRYMVVNNDKATPNERQRRYLLIQQTISKEDYDSGLFSSVVNYVQSPIFFYAAFVPYIGSDGLVTGNNQNIKFPVSFIVSEYSEDGIGDYQKDKLSIFLRSDMNVIPGTANVFDTTVEIESPGSGEEPKSYSVNLYAWQFDANGRPVDVSNYGSTMNVYVDNTKSFAPTPGATFLMNPKTRNNSEENPATILNARADNALVESLWEGFSFGESDGWTTDDNGQRILRVPAGRKLNIRLNPFAQFYRTPESSMTWEIDYVVRNVTDPESAQVIGCNELSENMYIGLRMEAMRGFLMPASAKTKPDVHDFSWQEDRRTHVAINIVTGYRSNPNGNIGGNWTEDVPVNLVSIFVNGTINRQFTYDVSRQERDEFCTGDMSNGGIIIGSDSADVDIYSMRVYSNRSLTPRMCQQNYKSTLSTSAEKIKFDHENDICNEDGQIVASKVAAQGKRILVLHAQVEPSHANTAKRPGYWEVRQYNDDGTINNDISGTLCKQSYLDYINGLYEPTDDDAPLYLSRQGSTANTYEFSNHQGKLKDVTHKIRVYLSAEDAPAGAPYLHSDLSYTATADGVMVNGGCIDKSVVHLYANAAKTAIWINDGWVDFNNAYHGMCFHIAIGFADAQKLVNKINYASSMQSHLQGGVRSYNDLHRRCCKQSDILKNNPKARVAKYTEPFFYFFQNDEAGEPIFRGPSTFGPGKMDDNTWGVDKKKYPLFCMIEGAENNYPLTDFRVPFDFDHIVRHIKDGECDGYSYPNTVGQDDYSDSVNIDIDKFASNAKDSNGNKIPSADIEQKIAEFVNFFYLHNTDITYFNGSYDAFRNSTTLDRMKKYWIAGSGQHQYELFRFCYITGTWVPAGLWNGSSYDTVNLSTDAMTSAAFAAVTNKNELSVLNQMFRLAIATHAKANADDIISTDSLKFHYCYVNTFLAGTDNCSKNTYYVLVPFTEGGVTKWLWEFHQDDLDTIFLTDNSAYQSKPYYIDRQHPCADGTTTSLYEGDANGLFNLCELMYGKEDHSQPGNTELQQTMFNVFSTMSSISGSVWSFVDSYFFDVQRYFPASAYNEAARIRYVFPCSIGFTSDERHVPPIEQSLGDQLEAEMQYMRRRIIYLASYAEFGAFGVRGAGGSIGISDADDSGTFGLQASLNPDGSICRYAFDVTPHQYIYPSGTRGGNLAAHPHIRVAPGQTYHLDLGEETGDTGVQILGANYYRSFGNIGNMAFNNLRTYTLDVRGKRLTEFVCRPERLYQDMREESPTFGSQVTAFRPSAISISNATNIRKFDMTGVDQTFADLDLTKLTRATDIQLGRTSFTRVYTPHSELLHTLHLGPSLVSISISDCPGLTDFIVDGYTHLRSLTIGDNTGSLNSQRVAEDCYIEGAPLDSVDIRNVSWTDLDITTMMWLTDINDAHLNGKIQMREPSPASSVFNFERKNLINRKWGNVDYADSSYHKGLLISYNIRPVAGGTVQGNFYNDGSEYYQFDVVPNVLYDNGFTRIEWVFAAPPPAAVNVSLDADTGRLYVGTPLPKTKQRVSILAKIDTWNGTSSGQITYGKGIYIWDRPAMLGDYVFADGTFSDERDKRKTVVGICCYVAPRDEDGNIIPELSNPNDTQTRLMVALENVTTDDPNNDFIWQWGCYPSTAADTGFFYRDEQAVSKLFGTGVNNQNNWFYDISDIVDISLSGLDADPTNMNTQYHIGNNNLRDTATSKGIANGGFRCFTVGNAAGDGFGYMESTTALQQRTLDSELASLAGPEYKAGDIVNSGYAKTLKIIKHRNARLNEGLPQFGSDFQLLSVPSATGGKTELENLIILMREIRMMAQTKLGETAQNSRKYSQIYYPAASAAYAYEPRVQIGETLHPRFKAHNWFLPPAGLLARLYWYRKRVANTEDDIFKSAVESSASLTTGSLGKFVDFIASYHWSATEFSQTYAWYVYFGSGYFDNYYKSFNCVVRAVAAF